VAMKKELERIDERRPSADHPSAIGKVGVCKLDRRGAVQHFKEGHFFDAEWQREH